jgi:hypothetical protein
MHFSIPNTKNGYSDWIFPPSGKKNPTSTRFRSAIRGRRTRCAGRGGNPRRSSFNDSLTGNTCGPQGAASSTPVIIGSESKTGVIEPALGFDIARRGITCGTSLSGGLHRLARIAHSLHGHTHTAGHNQHHRNYRTYNRFSHAYTLVEYTAIINVSRYPLMNTRQPATGYNQVSET